MFAGSTMYTDKAGIQWPKGEVAKWSAMRKEYFFGYDPIEREACELVALDLKKKRERTGDSFIPSAIIGAVTNSTLLGALFGGSLLGALFGDALNDE
jgi:hypothetical protein